MVPSAPTTRRNVRFRRPAVVVALVVVTTCLGVLTAVADGPAGALTAPVPGSLVAASNHTCSLTASGGVKCWGQNDQAQLGIGTLDWNDHPVPSFVTGLSSGVAAIDTGPDHTCAVTTAGALLCWGENNYGQLGDGTTETRTTPVPVQGLSSGVTAVATGELFTCALTTTGAKCWGWNIAGMLGDGTTQTRLTPVDVVGVDAGAVDISAGTTSACVVTAGGGVKCWGADNYGQLGDGGGAEISTTAVDVAGLTSGATQVEASGYRGCAVVAGSAQCWGVNAQVTAGMPAISTTPVTVPGLASGVASLGSGDGFHTCVVMTDGAVQCWGANNLGQLGDGTTAPPGTPRWTPAPVTGLSSGYVAVAVGGGHSCAAAGDGGLTCWGDNYQGDLGDGTTVRRLTPVATSGSFYRTECSALIAAPHTGFTLDDGYAVGSTATFTAEARWALDGPSTLTCGLGGVWSGTPPPAVATECPPLGTLPAHVALVSLSDGYHIGSVARFAADPGYVLVGSEVSTCRTDGTWSEPLPTAQIPTTARVVPGIASVREGDAGATTLEIPLTLSSLTTEPVTVAWTTLRVDGASAVQAEPGTDYTPVSGTATFAPGQTSTTVAVPVLGDLVDEPDELIVLSFHDPTNAVMGGYWGLGFGVITDDDQARVIPGAATVQEGGSGSVDVHVPATLSNPSALPVTVAWTTLRVDGASAVQAEPGTDYTPVSGTATFAPGQTSTTVAVPVLGDLVDEPDELIVLSFHDPTNAVMGGYWGLGFGVITDDD